MQNVFAKLFSLYINDSGMNVHFPQFKKSTDKAKVKKKYIFLFFKNTNKILIKVDFIKNIFGLLNTLIYRLNLHI